MAAELDRALAHALDDCGIVLARAFAGGPLLAACPAARQAIAARMAELLDLAASAEPAPPTGNIGGDAFRRGGHR